MSFQGKTAGAAPVTGPSSVEVLRTLGVDAPGYGRPTVS